MTEKIMIKTVNGINGNVFLCSMPEPGLEAIDLTIEYFPSTKENEIVSRLYVNTPGDDRILMLVGAYEVPADVQNTDIVQFILSEANKDKGFVDRVAEASNRIADIVKEIDPEKDVTYFEKTHNDGRC